MISFERYPKLYDVLSPISKFKEEVRIQINLEKMSNKRVNKEENILRRYGYSDELIYELNPILLDPMTLDVYRYLVKNHYFSEPNIAYIRERILDGNSYKDVYRSYILNLYVAVKGGYNEYISKM